MSGGGGASCETCTINIALLKLESSEAYRRCVVHSVSSPLKVLGSLSRLHGEVGEARVLRASSPVTCETHVDGSCTAPKCFVSGCDVFVYPDVTQAADN